MAKKQSDTQAGEASPAPSFSFDLVVTKNFGDFRKGDRIEDAEIIAKVLVENAHEVTKVAKSA